jgi:hypothetical protein
MTLWTIFPAGRLIGAKARAFVAFVEKMLASPPALAAGAGPALGTASGPEPPHARAGVTGLRHSKLE